MESTGTAYRKHQGVSGEFDAIVIGSGMGGLSVASLLAQEGKRILLLEQNNVVGGMTQAYTRSGYRWTVGMHYIGEVGSTKGTGWKLFNRATAGRIEWSALPAIFNRMVIGDRAYDIPAGIEAYGDFLKAHFPEESVAIDAYLTLIGKVAKSSGPYFAQKALPQKTAEKIYDAYCAEFHQYSRELTIDALRKLTKNEELIAVLCANWGDYSLEPSKSAFAMHCMLAKHYLNGAHYPVGGRQRLCQGDGAHH
ncbi:phytoene desaturase family protein [Undibacterium sp. Di26W]|uniref:phytoene desaturase family protein n=1 Tax=Undibacterium sp. Di26W TaxID=3413035 RepID=UPI003BF3FBC9